MPAASLLATRASRVTVLMCCLFGVYGVMLPYLARWLEVERGLTGAQIGAVLALSQLARIVTGPLIAFWADGAADRRTPIRLLATAALAGFAAFFFLARDFAQLLALGFLALTFTQVLTPFLEAALLRASEEGRLSYGMARGLGTGAFIVANVAGGALMARFGVGAVVVWMLTGIGLLLASSLTVVPPDPAPGDATERDPGARLAMAMRLLRSRRFLMLIAACGMIQAAHAFYYSFSTLVWRSQDIGPGTIGWLWAVGCVAEVAFLWCLPPIERRLSAEQLILIGGAGAVLRWTLMGFGPTGWVLWPIQLLHALTFAAAHVGAMRLLFRETPLLAQGLSQTLYAALASGLFMGLSTLVSGFLYDLVHVRGYWAMAGLALMGTALAWPLFASATRTAAVPQPGEDRP